MKRGNVTPSEENSEFSGGTRELPRSGSFVKCKWTVKWKVSLSLLLTNAKLPLFFGSKSKLRQTVGEGKAGRDGEGDVCLQKLIDASICNLLPLLITPPCPLSTSPHWASTELLSNEGKTRKERKERNQTQKPTERSHSLGFVTWLAQER